jgi:hypothetical protein
MEQAFARARAHGAPQAAPDLVDRAERARRDALQVSDREAKRLHQSAARTWLAAALAEAERLRWEDARLEAEARRAEAARRAAGARRALGRLAAEDRARARGRIVSGEIRRIAEPSGSGRRPPVPPDPVLLRAAEARWARARLTLAAARALGAEASVVDRLDGPFRRRPRESPSAALTRAEAFEDRALALLAAARRDRPPSPATGAALREALVDAGLEPTWLPRGLAVSLADGGGPRRRQVRVLGEVAARHPRGPVVVEQLGPAGGPAGRAGALVRRALVAAGVEADRLAVAEVETPGAWAGEVVVVFPAYGDPAVASDPGVPSP